MLKKSNEHSTPGRDSVFKIIQFVVAYKKAQTPVQRIRNEKFAKQQNAKRGKPTFEPMAKNDSKKSLSPVLVGLLAFIIFGGLAFELLSRILFR
ncbi:hypothetical protein OnM2_062046 [Erysiphe neolycopersici]|uniref:Stress-associated endoplasmic reticulum protein n=1 Tax=Erysiphe neolycopersici TaxID=212602 RepID=A0A420HP54_9PEZI|nr:hypothetical protein OnM2_062046 [Erysiphe neolycopersici]